MQTFVQQVVNGLAIGSTYALVALGFGLIFSVMRVLQIAHPDLMMVGAYGTYAFLRYLNPSGTAYSLAGGLGVYAMTLVVGMAVAGAGGLVLERLVIRPLRGSYIMMPLIATAGVSFVLENGAAALFGTNAKPVASVFHVSTVQVAGIYITNMHLVAFGTAVVMMIGVGYYVRRTRWGLATRAVAERPEVASACGVNVNRVSQLTIGMASAMAGAAGVTLALLYTSANPTMGMLYGLKSFVCMLVAGNRHIEGIMAIGLSLGIVESLVTGYISSSLTDIFSYGLLLTILVFRPNGIFGSYET
jgi:branched-chain amino acid transport system permease protein